MLTINCPWCGPRAEQEFSYGGESALARPEFAAASDGEWAAYLYFRTNPKGEHRERWRHAFGCRQWFNVARDTCTHAIRATYKMGEGAPEASL